MKTHGNGSADELSTHGPEVFALVFGYGKIMCAEEEELDKFETVCLALCMVALEGCRSNTIIMFAEIGG